jgi:hypothetical protein
MISDTLSAAADGRHRTCGANLAASASRPTERAKSAAFMSLWLRTVVLAPRASSNKGRVVCCRSAPPSSAPCCRWAKGHRSARRARASGSPASARAGGRVVQRRPAGPVDGGALVQQALGRVQLGPSERPASGASRRWHWGHPPAKQDAPAAPPPPWASCRAWPDAGRSGPFRRASWDRTHAPAVRSRHRRCRSAGREEIVVRSGCAAENPLKTNRYAAILK